MKDTYKYPLALTQQFRFCGNPFRLDFYRGCDFGCKYCFANARQGGFKQTFDYANFSIVENYFKKAFDSNKEYKNITIELLRHKVPIHIGGMSDPFQTREWKLKLNYKMIQLSNKYNYPLIFSTKTAHLPDEYFEVLNPELHAFQISLFGFNEDFVRKYETNTPSPKERINFIKKLKDKGFWVSVRIQPMIDLDEAITLCENIDGLVDYITVEHLKIPTDNKAVRKLFEPFDKDNYYRPSSLRNYELHREIKEKNIKEIKKHVKHTKIGCGDNDIHHLSDSNCCCGVDTINENFNSWLKYNFTYFVTKNPDIKEIDSLYIPESSVSSVLNPDTRLQGKKAYSDYVHDYCEKKQCWMCENCHIIEKINNVRKEENNV